MAIPRSKDSSNESPSGWYVGTYQLRFVELDDPGIDDDDSRFRVWENTVLIKAESIETAYEKIVDLGRKETAPYKGGPEGVDVQWCFEGIIELLPVYEELRDGCEIMWTERAPRKLKNIRAQSQTIRDLSR